MPTYEYACPACGIVEAFQSMRDKPLTRCPSCRTAKVARLVSAGAGVIFKGSGFWETDYNRSPSQGPIGAASNAPAEPATAKPATTAT